MSASDLPHLNITAVLKAVEACGRAACGEALPNFLALLATARSILPAQPKKVGKIESSIRTVQHSARDHANSLIESARAQINRRYSAYAQSKALKVKRDRAQCSGRDYTVAGEFEDAKEQTLQSILKWRDARKLGFEGLPQVGTEADALLRRAYSYRALEAALECYVRSATPVSKIVLAFLETVLVVFGPEQARSVCQDLFQSPKEAERDAATEGGRDPDLCKFNVS